MPWIRCGGCCPGGHYIPSITYGLPGAVYPHVDRVHRPGHRRTTTGQLHVPRFDLPPVPRRVRAVAVRQAAGAGCRRTATYWPAWPQRWQQGQQKKVLALCREALEQGIDAAGDPVRRADAGHERAGRGLLRQPGLRAGDADGRPVHDGGAGGAEAADDRRQHAETVGRACIGTVRGDMHDIGKNLVKIMLEGSGIEVVDLGVDVTPEQFVETAQRAALRHHRLLVPADHHHAARCAGW